MLGTKMMGEERKKWENNRKEDIKAAGELKARKLEDKSDFAKDHKIKV